MREQWLSYLVYDQPLDTTAPGHRRGQCRPYLLTLPHVVRVLDHERVQLGWDQDKIVLNLVLVAVVLLHDKTLHGR